MKQSFSAILFLLFTAFLAVACNTTKIKFSDIPVKAGTAISFNAHGHTTTVDTVFVKRGATIKWKALHDSEIDGFLLIRSKPASAGLSDAQFFDELPAIYHGNSRKWKAKIKTTLNEGDMYIYNIKWWTKDDTDVRVFDPVICIRVR